MSLHDAFRKQDVQRIQRLLQPQLAGIPLPSPGHRGKRASVGQQEQINVNQRDHLGRTVLHLVAADPCPRAAELVAILLDHPSINVNLQDAESGWTALHRALYAGNLSIALSLLSRKDTDIRIKDLEGNTALDVLNSTVEGTNPQFDLQNGGAELYTWGVNTSYVLGRNDMDNRAYPERVFLHTTANGLGLPSSTVKKSTPVKDIAMAKFHTGVITCNKDDNYQTCGFGVGGRLGLRTEKTQFTFKSVGLAHARIEAVALGLDHTILITDNGEVYTFGSNKHGQLGYILETKNTRDEPVQTSPRKVVGPLKREIVIGAAASRVHSVVFTATELFTWGTNNGQLGYDTAGQQQPLPRKVSSLAHPIIQVATTDNATACLLTSHDVVVYANDTHFRVAFPMQRFSDDIAPYRPAHHFSRHISRITCGGQTFAALSSMGDVFAFTVQREESGARDKASISRWIPKPQRVWSLRKKFLAVRDIAVGQTGDLILCTESGHVYVRDRRREPKKEAAKAKANQPYKFSRVPFLQRVVLVRGNEAGGFAAIRSDAAMDPLGVEGNTIGDDLRNVIPHYEGAMQAGIIEEEDSSEDISDAGSEGDRSERSHNFDAVRRLVKIHNAWEQISRPEVDPHLHISFKTLDGRVTYVHKVILAARSAVFDKLFRGESEVEGIRTRQGADCLDLEVNASHLAVLAFVEYLYTDELCAFWDPVSIPQLSAIPELKNPSVDKIKSELRDLAKAFRLPALISALQAFHMQRPTPTLTINLMKLICEDGGSSEYDIYADTKLVFKDKQIKCHSIILKSRCPFFEAMFGRSTMPDYGSMSGGWLSERQKKSGESSLIDIDVRHLRWEVASLVMQYLHGDEDLIRLQTKPSDSLDSYTEFVVEVLAAANELLLAKLKLICQATLQRCVTVGNASMILSYCDHYAADELKNSLLDYVCQNIETMLEGHLFDDLDDELIADIEEHLKTKQLDRMPVSKSGSLLNELMDKYRNEIDDICEEADKLSLQSPSFGPSRSSAGSSYGGRSFPCSFTPLHEDVEPEYYTVKSNHKMRTPIISPQASPSLGPSLLGEDLMFSMDDDMQSHSRAENISRNTDGEWQKTRRKRLPYTKAEDDLPISDNVLSSSPASSKPWRQLSRATDTPKFQQILAESSGPSASMTPAASSSRSPAFAPVRMRQVEEEAAIHILPKLSQRERKRGQAATPDMSANASPVPRRTSLTPWAVADAPSPKTLQDIQLERATGSPSTTVKTSPIARVSSFKDMPALSAAAMGKANVASASAEVIIPMRAQPAVITPTRAAVNAANTAASMREIPWAKQYQLHDGFYPSIGTTPPTNSGTAALSPSSILGLTPPSRSPTNEKLSFAAIQAQQFNAVQTQRDQIEQMRKKSLVEIQAEEKARQEKEAFEAWFEDEVERIKREGESSSRGRGRGRGGGGGGARGRGRGQQRGKPRGGGNPNQG